MSTQATTTKTETGWVHADGSPCEHRGECSMIAPVFFFGGRPEHPDVDVAD